MSARKLVELQCDHRRLNGRCKETVTAAVGTIHEARAFAEAQRWGLQVSPARGGKSLDYCPTHAAEADR